MVELSFEYFHVQIDSFLDIYSTSFSVFKPPVASHLLALAIQLFGKMNI